MTTNSRTPSLRRPHPALAAAAFVAVIGLAAPACSSDDDSGASGTDDAAASATDNGVSADNNTDGGSDAGSADGEVLTVLGTDFDFEDLPDTIPAGTRLELANDSNVELHEIVAFRIDDDEDRSIDELIELPEDELMPILGFGPVTVILTPPEGEQINAVGDGTLTEPGRYALLCAIPTGIDPGVYLEAAAEAGDGPPMVDGGGPPHFVHGMYAEVTVQ